ncbi:MAG: hypothetical protein COA78_23720 [Blastopirellula sp.]|nr:MAG: hypothetical protein COA78_23720 [Blastopirellula sp.]
MESLERREVLDGSGIDLTESAHSGHQDTNDILEVTLVATDLAEQPISQIESGEHFLLKVFVHDIRHQEKLVTQLAFPNTAGVFAAYFDIEYDPLAASIDTDSEITPREGVTINRSDLEPDLSTAGVINNVGRYDGANRANPGDRIHWFSIPMIAGAAGTNYDFTIVHPENNPILNTGYNEIQLNSNGGEELAKSDDNIHYISTQLSIVEADPVADFEFRVVTTPTSVDLQGEVTTFPTNEDSLTEFDNVYVEVYAKAPAGAILKGGHAIIEFNSDLFDVIDVIDVDATGLKFSSDILEERNTSNSVTFQFSSIYNTAGDDNYALVGRVQLGVAVANNPVNDYIKPVTSSIQLTHAGGTVTYDTNNIIDPELHAIAGTISEENAAFDLWAVMYDTDDNGSIGLTDLSKFVNNFGGSGNSPTTYQLDFNHDGQIGLSDLALLVNNFGIGRGNGADLTFAAAFPSQFLIPGPAPLFAGLLEAEPIDVAQEIPLVTASVAATQPITNLSETAEIISTTILPIEINSSTGISSLDNLSSSNNISSNSQLLAQSYQVIDMEAESLILDSLNAEVELLVTEDLEDTDAIDSVLAEFENGQDTWVL